MSHTIVSSNNDGIECLTCAVVCQGEEVVVDFLDFRGAREPVTAGDLLPPCPGLHEGQAHHFAPAVGAIVCQWCQMEVTAHSAAIPAACIRPE